MGRQTVTPPERCTQEGCDRAHRARGFCETHYWQARKSGALRPIREIPNDERFDDRWQLDPQSGCHIWMRGKDSAGYGKFLVINGPNTRAHVYAWERKRGPVPAGLVLDHFVCDNKACCNPDHLRAVPNAANITRRNGSRNYDPDTLQPRRDTHCVHGHEWTPENTYAFVDRSGHRRRNCRTCNHARSVARGIREREARHARGLRHQRRTTA